MISSSRSLFFPQGLEVGGRLVSIFKSFGGEHLFEVLMDWTDDNTFFEFPTYGCNGFQDELDRVFGTSCEWPWSTVAQESGLGAAQSLGDGTKVPIIQEDKMGSWLCEQQQLPSYNWNVNQVDLHYAPGMGVLDLQQQEFESSGAQHSFASHLEFNQRQESYQDHGQIRFYDSHQVLQPKTLWCRGDHDNISTVTNEQDQFYLPTMTSTSMAAPISAQVPAPTYFYAREQYSPDSLNYNLSCIRDHDMSGVNTGIDASDINARANLSLELNGVDLLKFDPCFATNQSVPQFDYHPMEMAIQLHLQGTLQFVEKRPSYLNDEVEIESSLREHSIAELQNLTGCFQPRDSSFNSVAPVTPIMSREMNKKDLPSEAHQVPETGESREELEVSSGLSSLSPSTVESEAAVIQDAVACHRKVIDWAYEKEMIVLCMLGKQDADDPSHSVLHEELQLIINDFQVRS
ncbi:hypothetical protein R1sor_001493 [Riccia sorocarpa]|uniref:Uncharacterized protein n=1 Tax=Riccia sorocarpa TaxID=122646 RepID=A0ABD3H095_9MARC